MTIYDATERYEAEIVPRLKELQNLAVEMDIPLVIGVEYCDTGEVTASGLAAHAPNGKGSDRIRAASLLLKHWSLLPRAETLMLGHVYRALDLLEGLAQAAAEAQEAVVSPPPGKGEAEGTVH